jgi:hypothetical protein
MSGDDVAATSHRGWHRLVLASFVVVVAAILRTRDVSHHFWLMGDQIRDWAIALRPFSDLPLVGPPTHVDGYTIGPAFYWILWLIRVVAGPVFGVLPHVGGVGQAILLSLADGLLLLGVWRRTRSVWLALATVTLLVTEPFELSLAATIWNPVVGSLLARTAIALILLDWHRGSIMRTALIAAVAWCAVHAYTGAIFVTLAVFVALLVEPAIARDWGGVSRRALVIAVTVLALQIPWLIHQLATGFGDSGMTAVTGNLTDVVRGRAPVRLGQSAAAYVASLLTLQEAPGAAAMWSIVLIACTLALVIRRRADPALLAVTLLPQILTIAGYALWRDDFKTYFYLSLATPAVLTLVLGSAAWLSGRAATVAAAALCVGAVAIGPAHVRAATQARFPEYGALASGATQIAARHEPMEGIDADFALPPTCNAEFLYLVLGGQLDPHAAWRAVIHRDGTVEYLRAGS